MSAVRPERKPKSLLREYTEAIVYAVLLTIVLRAFVLQAFRIPSESMLDTLQVGDYLFVSKLDYGPKIPFTDVRLPGFRQPEPGDVIVFQYPEDPRRDYIKRLVATGGQTVEIKDKTLYVDGQKRTEPYVKHIDTAMHPGSMDQRDNFGPVTVPPDKLFMMGDNRDNSNDSRFWGPVPMNLVKGRAMFLYWSWDGERKWPRFQRILTAIR
ncbi:MAG: signal peptidase I [Candidatus Eiseniibacteriota bacterium]|jgi:signal peptidase I